MATTDSGLRTPAPGCGNGHGPEAIDGLLRAKARAIVADLDGRGAGLAADHGGDGAGVLDVRSRLLGLGVPGRTTAGGRGMLVAASDGWIALSLPRPEDLAALPAFLETDDAEPAGREFGDSVWALVESICARRPAGWWVERAGLLGLAAFAVGEFAGSPAAVLTRVGDAEPRPLASATVVNLAGLWAGPLAADVCARLGASVVTVESTGRPDGARLTPAFHGWLHRRDAAVSVDLRTSAGREELKALVAGADVVIEGSRPRALDQMGIDAHRTLASGPRVWVSITGAGRAAPHDARIGFGDDAAAGGGLVGWTDTGPVFVGDAAADPLAGLVAARRIASLLEAGGRWMVDVALARVAGSLWR